MIDRSDPVEVNTTSPRICSQPAWDEADRLAALDRYAVLDTAREPAFNDVAELAADIFDAPIAVVNFIAADRQWFKAEIGIGKDSLPLDVSICRHAILQQGVFVVPDLTNDARFENNPLVVASDGLRFYAGALLETPEGLPLGTVCVLDTKARPEGITARQERALSALAAQTMAQLELRRSNAAARQERDRLSAMFAQATVGMSEIGLDGRFLTVNDRLCEIVGRARDELLTLSMADVTHPDDLPENVPMFDRMADTGESFSLDKRYVRPDGTIVWANSSVTRLLDESGRPRAALAVTTDITERKEEEHHRAFLLELADRTRGLADPEGVIAATATLVGEHLGAARVLYADFHEAEDRATIAADWAAPGSKNLPSSVGLADLGSSIVEHLRRGKTLCVNDVLSDPLTSESVNFLDERGVRALISVPLLKDGGLVASLNVHKAKPHVWTSAELQLVEAAAERTWEAVQRALSEAALEESEARYRQIVEGAEDFAIATADEHGTITSWNTGAARITGFAEDDIIGRSGEIIFTPEDRTAGAPEHELNRAESDGRFVNERWHLRKDGSRFWGSGLTMRLDQPGGGYLKIFRDRTAEHEAEAQQAFLLSLADALRPLRTAAEIAWTAAERLGERFSLSRVFYAEYFGSLMKVERDYTNEVPSIVGEHDLQAFGPELLSAYHTCPVVKVDDVRTDARFSNEARSGLLARQVGAYLDVVLFEKEQWVGLLALQSATPRKWTISEESIFREVGERVKAALERVRAEDRLRELNATLECRVADALAEKKLLADLVEGTDAFVQVADPEFRWLAINKAASNEFERIYGIRPRVGDCMLDLLADKQEHQQEVRAIWARALAGEVFTEIAEFGEPGCDRRFYEMKFNALRGANGEQIGAYQFVYDVTDRINEQRRLAEAEEALRQSQKMEAMGQLTGGVAHDFNNLLTPIVGSLDMLQRKGLGNEREQRLIAGAAQSAERAKTLVQRLLAFARRQPLQAVPVDIAKLVHGMGDLVLSTTGPQIKVLVEAPDDLPAAKADPNQLEMALLNLAVNARDAMPDNGTLRITASAEAVGPEHPSKLRPDTYIRLSVADTGCGMDATTIAHAVEPFFSTKGVGKGTGLGLSMVHGLASQLGGALTINSRPGLGTNVELWLPLSEAIPDDANHIAESSHLPAVLGTALLVDDEELVRMSTADMLADLGYAVVEAPSAEAALELATLGEPFDILVTDHLMPGMNGTDLAQAMKKLKPGIPILLVSGYAESDGVDPGLPRLTKPFRKDELAARLAQMSSVGSN